MVQMMGLLACVANGRTTNWGGMSREKALAYFEERRVGPKKVTGQMPLGLAE